LWVRIPPPALHRTSLSERCGRYSGTFGAISPRAAPRPSALVGGEIACPTAVVWGRDDVYLRPAIAEELGERIPEAQLTVIPGAGHFVMEESPAEVTAALSRLLDR
jgi:cis-3-alkyl-4-acyloxetan-2-one decarboxylase